MHRSITCIAVTALVCRAVIAYGQDHTEHDTAMAYLTLPAAAQMECALHKLHARLDARRGGGDWRSIQRLEEARIALEKTLTAYGVRSDSIGYDPGDSPWTLLQHLWAAGAMLEANSSSKAQASLKQLSETTEIVERDRGWIPFSDGESVAMEAPPAFRVIDNPHCRLKLDRPDPVTGKTVETFYINVQEALIDMDERDYQWEVLSRAQAKHDYYILLEEERKYVGVDGIWCLYGYLWNDIELWTFVFHRLAGDDIWTMTFTARADHFSGEMCEGMIRSVRRL